MASVDRGDDEITASTSSLQHLEEQAIRSGRPGDDNSSVGTNTALNVALPASVASSLRQLREYHKVSRANGDGSIRSASGMDVALPGSATSSLLRLEGHVNHIRPANDASSTHSTSASNVPLPASASSSLQALARLDSNSSSKAEELQEWAHPLPPSRRSSLESTDTIHGLVPSLADGIPLDTLAASSLEQLQNAGATSHADRAQHVQPANFPLPSSPAGSSNLFSERGRRPSPSVDHEPERRKEGAPNGPAAYAARVKALWGGMSHLSSLLWTSTGCRNPTAGAAWLVDFHGSLVDYEVRSLKTVDESWSMSYRELLNVPKQAGSGVSSRLLIVEDLSPSVINIVGSAFEVDPEAFASQLSRGRPSIYRGHDDEEDRWITSGMSTSNASIQWYRPVNLDVDVAEWLKDSTSLKSLLGDADTGKNCRYWFEKVIKKRPYDGYIVSQEDIHHRTRIITNLFRRSWLLSTKLAENDRQSVPTAWEEKATIFKVEDATVPTLILLVDPLPAIRDTQTITETLLKLDPMPTRETREPNEEEVGVHFLLPSRITVPLKLPANKFHISDQELEDLRQASGTATSTATAVQSWLSTLSNQVNPVLALLEVVRLDSVAFFDSLDVCLKEISQDSMDDYLMTRKLGDWRQLLNDFESKVTELSQSLHYFIDFVFDDPSGRPARVQDIIEELDSRTQRFSQRIEKAYAALRAEMGLFESRRSIAEAETVTKLTELAFVFIPLTFCCGLFSMQIHELKNGVPLRSFIIAAVIVFVVCYGARIILRSSIIVESTRSAKESLWAAGKMKPGSPIPTRQLLWLTLKEAWKRGGSAATYVVFLFVLSFTVVPVAFLWTTVRLDSSLNVMIMLLLIPLGILLAWICATAYTKVSGTSWEEVPLALRMALWFSTRRVDDSRYDTTSASNV